MASPQARRGRDGVNAITNVAPRHDDRTIGALLVEAGKLRFDDLERVLQLQREQPLRFGEAALRLGLVGQTDIDHALARQFRYPCLVRGESAVSEELQAAYDATAPEAEALRTLRSQLTLRWFDGGDDRRALAIVGAARGDGRSRLAASLAVVFSQLGKRTVLIDADLRHAGQHALFGLDNRVGLSNLLAGRNGQEAIRAIHGLPDLSVLTAGTAPPNPADLLDRPQFAQLIGDLARTFDVVLLDTPSTTECADAYAVARCAGAALMVTRQDRTRVAAAAAATEKIKQMNAVVVGAVFNDF